MDSIFKTGDIVKAPNGAKGLQTCQLVVKQHSYTPSTGATLPGFDVLFSDGTTGFRYLHDIARNNPDHMKTMALYEAGPELHKILCAMLAAGSIDGDGDFLLPRESDDDGQEVGPPPSFVSARVALELLAAQGIPAADVETHPSVKRARLQAWGKTLSEDQLDAALHEMRDRGAAVAYYDAGEFQTMFDGEELNDVEAWMEDNRYALEEAMCERAREFFRDDYDI